MNLFMQVNSICIIRIYYQVQANFISIKPTVSLYQLHMMNLYKVDQAVWVQIQIGENQINLWPAIIDQITCTNDRQTRFQYEVYLIDKDESFSNETLLIDEQKIIPFECRQLNERQANASLINAYKCAKEIHEEFTRQAGWIEKGLEKPNNMHNFLWKLAETFKPITLNRQMIEAIGNCQLHQRYLLEYNRRYFCQMLNFLINERNIDNLSRLALDGLRNKMKKLNMDYKTQAGNSQA